MAKVKEKNETNLRRLWADVEAPIIPRHDNSREGSPGDRDSGMCSIGSRDSELGSERDLRRIYPLENGDQISSVGSKRFWTTGYKYHTFGGIKVWPKRSAEDLEDPDDLDDLNDESVSPDDRLEQSNYAPEFARFKFQTFGGIRRSRRKIDGRKIRLRPMIPFKAARKSHDSPNRIRTEKLADEERPECPEHLVQCSSSLEGFASFENSTSSALEESDWQDEEDDVVNDRVQSTGSVGCGVGSRNVPGIKHKNSTRRRNANLSSASAADVVMMDKFLKDVSKRRKECAFCDDNVTTLRGRRVKSRRRREISKESIDEKSEKSTIRNYEKSSESSKGFRRARERKNDNKRQRDNLDVRSLSDVTIW